MNRTKPTRNDGAANTKRAVFGRIVKPGRLLSCVLPSDGPETFESLCSAKQFGTIAQVLTSERTDPIVWLEETNPALPLHMLLEQQPPLWLVNLLCRVLSCRHCLPEAERDAAGRTALHVACEHNCEIAVVARFMNGSTNPASIQDGFDRYPLHCAASLGLDAMSSKSNHASLQNLLDVIGFLVAAYPEAIAETDSMGMTPLDLLTIHQADDSLRKLLEAKAKGAAKLPRTAVREQRDVPVKEIFGSAFVEDSDLSTVGFAFVGDHLYKEKEAKASKQDRRLHHRKSNHQEFVVRPLKEEGLEAAKDKRKAFEQQFDTDGWPSESFLFRKGARLTTRGPEKAPREGYETSKSTNSSTTVTKESTVDDEGGDSGAWAASSQGLLSLASAETVRIHNIGSWYFT